MVQQIKSEVLDNRRVGDYHVLSLTAPGIAESAQPGHFVTIAMGGEESSMVLRRAFAIHQVASRASTEGPWTLRSPSPAQEPSGWPAGGATMFSTSWVHSVNPSPFPSRGSPVFWSVAATAAHRCSCWPKLYASAAAALT